MFLLERKVQLLRLPTLLIELGLKLPELRQLCLMFRRVRRYGWSSRCRFPYRGCRGLSHACRGIVVDVAIVLSQHGVKHSRVGS